MTPSHALRTAEGEVARAPLFSFRQPKLTSTEIIAEVANKHGLTSSELIEARWSHKLAPARQEAMSELRRRTKLSLPQIARRLGLTNHTTVIKGIRAFEARGVVRG